ncbi:MAG: CPBP family intramembrane metalloprotease [Candidatus Aenigmarchaeota archaeon]|nr:CPBP family intramembrane metalloprotease [Candidatus Aenigmarchaeota archaeon]
MEKRKGKSSLLLFVLVSYGQLWLLFGIGKLFDIPFSMDPRQLGGLLYIVGASAPLIAAILATVIISRREGLRLLFNRSFEWRFSLIWYLAAVSIPFIVTAVSTAAAISIIEAKVPEKWFSPAFGIAFLVFFLIYDGLGEEVGWRGLALPELQRRLGSLGGNIILGIIWALWHLPLFFMPGSFQYGDSLFIYVYLLTCWSIVIALLVNKARGSVLVAILFHETANFIAFTIRYPQTYYVLFVWGVAAAIAIVFLPRPLVRLPWKSYRSFPSVAQPLARGDASRCDAMN